MTKETKIKVTQVSGSDNIVGLTDIDNNQYNKLKILWKTLSMKDKK